MEKKGNRTQTKCTIALCCLFFVEILPLPFTGFISMFVIRRRPAWFPRVVENLYEDFDTENPSPAIDDNGGAATRKRCTMCLIAMILIDLGPVPVTIPVGLYVVRKRPAWFRNVVGRLYSDDARLPDNTIGEADSENRNADEIYHRKNLELQRLNLKFSRSVARKSSITNHQKQFSGSV